MLFITERAGSTMLASLCRVMRASPTSRASEGEESGNEGPCDGCSGRQPLTAAAGSPHAVTPVWTVEIGLAPKEYLLKFNKPVGNEGLTHVYGHQPSTYNLDRFSMS